MNMRSEVEEEVATSSSHIQNLGRQGRQGDGSVRLVGAFTNVGNDRPVGAQANGNAMPWLRTANIEVGSIAAARIASQLSVLETQFTHGVPETRFIRTPLLGGG